MNASELKYLVENARPNSRFFSRENMKFAGDTMTNYGVRSTKIKTYSGDTVEVWELYRRRAVKHGLQTSAYFDKATLEQRFSSD